jgi:hypothetical protein
MPTLGLAALAITMVWGAFTAGLRAGLVYNTFPLMGGGFAPPDVLALHPWWSNFVENPGAVQFTHRMLAMTTGLILMALALRLRAPTVAPELRKAGDSAVRRGRVADHAGYRNRPQPGTGLARRPASGQRHPAAGLIVVRTLFLLRVPATAKFKPK